MRRVESSCQAMARAMVPMLAGQRIRMQQVRRQSVRTALYSRLTPVMIKQTNALQVHTMSSTAPKKKELAMLAGEEELMLTRQS